MLSCDVNDANQLSQEKHQQNLLPWRMKVYVSKNNMPVRRICRNVPKIQDWTRIRET